MTTRYGYLGPEGTFTQMALLSWTSSHEGEHVPFGSVDSALEAALDSAPYPKSLPAYERILADPSGHLWVLEYSIRYGQPQSWSVFDVDGRWLGTVRTPPGLRVEQVGESWVIGAWRDDAGREHVRLHELRR